MTTKSKFFLTIALLIGIILIGLVQSKSYGTTITPLTEEEKNKIIANPETDETSDEIFISEDDVHPSINKDLPEEIVIEDDNDDNE